MPSLLRKLSFLGLFLLLAGFLLLDYGWLNFTENIDQRTGDVLLKMHAKRRPASSDVVVIDIDQKSLEDLNNVAGNWPWPRSIHGEMVEGLAKQKPRAIVFDFLFNELDTYRPESDAYFRDAVKAHPETYLSVVLLSDGTGATPASLPAILKLERGPKAGSLVPPLLLPWVLPKESWRGGIVNFDKDSDGIGRYSLLRGEGNGWRIPSMPARLAQDFGWKYPSTDRFMINWRSGRQHVSYSDLYLDFNREKPLRPANEFAGKIVIIGTTAPGLLDQRPTALDHSYPGVDILATSIDNLKQGDWLEAPARWHFAPLGLILMLLLSLGFRRQMNTLWLAMALLLVSVAALLLQWQMLAWQQFWPVAAGLVWAWGYYWLGALLAYLEAKAKGAQAVALFGRFLDARVVKSLVDGNNVNPAQHAEAHEVTVLFSDIRGFTTLSENHTPEYIVDLLNRYFTLQVEVIFRHGGTLDKFIGDCIMAFWGAPVHDPDHASQAVSAALEMARVLEDFRKEIPDLGEQFDVGIGIHTGTAVVGFIGSQARLDYTVIGDTVNLASRIEGLTKGVSRVLISDATRQACGDNYNYIHHGSHTVKGREQPVALFEPLLKESADA